MKRLFLSFILIFLSWITAFSQDINTIVKDASASRIRGEFSYTLAYNGEEYAGRGSIVMQDSCFVLKTPVLELYCDSESLWVVDKDAREVCIQSSEGLDPDAVLGGFGIRYKVISYSKGQKEKDLSVFSLNEKGLSSDYVVTDLR